MQRPPWGERPAERAEHKKKLEAHIPQKIAFVSATQCEGTGHKQHKIYMPNANPILAYPMRTLFHWLTLGLALVPPGFALGPSGFLDTNRSVSACVGGLQQCVWGREKCFRGLDQREWVRVVAEYRLLCPYYTMRWVCVLVKFVSKTQAKTFLAFLLHFSPAFSLAFWIPTCWYPKRE